MERLLLLTHIIEYFGPIKGEKTIQKLVYLVQSINDYLYYTFRWDVFGPVSFDIEMDLYEAEALGLIDISWENNVPIYTAIVNEYDLPNYWKSIYNKTYPKDTVLHGFRYIQEVLGNSIVNPTIMEIVASILYLVSSGYDLSINDIIELSGKSINQDELFSVKQIIDSLKLLNQQSQFNI